MPQASTPSARSGSPLVRALLTRLAARLLGGLLAALLLLWLLIDVLAGAAAPGFIGGLLGGAPTGSGAALGPMVLERLAVTVPLALLAFLIAVAGGLGLASADSIVPMRVPAALLAATPAFWAGLLLILGVAGGLKLLPASGFVPWHSNAGAALGSLLLPALAMGVPGAGQFARLLLNERDAVAAEAVQLLRSRGMTTGQARRRLAIARLRSSLPAILARLFVAIWIGTVLVEALFYLPGLGRLTLGAALQHDLPLFALGLYVLVCLAILGDVLLRLTRLALDAWGPA